MQWRGDDDSSTDWSHTQLRHAFHARFPATPWSPPCPRPFPIPFPRRPLRLRRLTRRPPTNGRRASGRQRTRCGYIGVYFTRNFYTRYILDGENIVSILSTAFLSFLAKHFRGWQGSQCCWRWLTFCGLLLDWSGREGPWRWRGAGGAIQFFLASAIACCPYCPCGAPAQRAHRARHPAPKNMNGRRLRLGIQTVPAPLSR